MNIIKGTFNMVGSMIRVSMVTSAVLIGGGLLLAGMTKPSDESFKKHLEENISKEIGCESDNILVRGVKKVAAGGLAYTMEKDVKDYVVVKIGHVKDGDEDSYYVGTLNNWIPIK